MFSSVSTLFPRVRVASSERPFGTLALNPSLTGLRGLAVLWVVVYHGNQVMTGSHYFPLISAGYLGVPIFLMLSISLLLSSLDRKPSFSRYMKRRIFRIWPLYFVSLGLVYIFFTSNHTIGLLLQNILFVGVWVHGLGTGYGYVFWTLQVEELAYLAYPLIHGLSLPGKRMLACTLILASVSGIWLSDTSYLFLPMTFASFGLGILIYTGDVKRHGSWLLYILCGLSVFFPDAGFGWCTGVLVLPGFAWMVANPPAFTEWWWLVAIGEMSYSIYLIHQLLWVRMGWAAIPMIIVAALVMEGRRLPRSLTWPDFIRRETVVGVAE